MKALVDGRWQPYHLRLQRLPRRALFRNGLPGLLKYYAGSKLISPLEDPLAILWICMENRLAKIRKSRPRVSFMVRSWFCNSELDRPLSGNMTSCSMLLLSADLAKFHGLVCQAPMDTPFYSRKLVCSLILRYLQEALFVRHHPLDKRSSCQVCPRSPSQCHSGVSF